MININSKTTTILFVLTAWLLSHGLLFGEEKKNETFTHPSFVDVVVVKGEAVEKTATVSLITAEQIKAKGIKSVAQALDSMPGLNVRVGGKGEAYVRMRGFRQREVALLVDGVPVSSPYDGQLDLSTLPVDIVERIEVVKGASSVLYGANSMGGVINIITRKGDGSSRFSVNGEYGSGQTGKINGVLQGSLGKVRYLVSGGWLDQDHFPLSDDYTPQKNQDEGDRDNSYRRSVNGAVNLGWDVGERGKASLNFNHVSIERGLPHHDFDKKAKYWQFTDWKEGTLDFLFQKNFDRVSFKSKVFYQYFNNVLDSFDDATYSTQDTKYAFTSSLKDYSLGGDVFFRYIAGKNLLVKTALRFHHVVHRQQDDVGEDWEKYKANILSIPLEAEWTATKHITFTFGASMDMMLFDKDAENESETTTALNPQAAILVTPVKRLTLRASAARKTRFPTMKELFSSTSGNTDLEPMKSNSFELGADYQVTDNVTLGLVGFYNDVTDLINRDKKDDPYINIDEAVFKGFEASMLWNIDAGTYVSLAYTRLTATDESDQIGTYIQYRPKHKVDSNLSLKLPAEFKCYLTVSYVSSQLYYDDDDMEQSLDAYTMVDLRISKRIGKKLEVYVAARNLFDVNYYESEGYPREGRMIFGGIRFEVL
jgi:iron complex outermembrane recepter protein